MDRQYRCQGGENVEAVEPCNHQLSLEGNPDSHHYVRGFATAVPLREGSERETGRIPREVVAGRTDRLTAPV